MASKFYSFAGNKSSSSSYRDKYVRKEKRLDFSDFVKAKAEADALKKQHAEELAARGGVPVSAQERSDLAQQQAMRYGVGVVSTKTPITVVDKGGKRTVIDQQSVNKSRLAYERSRVVEDQRKYGKPVTQPMQRSGDMRQQSPKRLPGQSPAQFLGQFAVNQPQPQTVYVPGVSNQFDLRKIDSSDKNMYGGDTYTAAENNTAWWDLPARLRNISQRQAYKEQTTKDDAVQKQVAGLSATAAGAGAGFFNIFFHPVQTIKGTYEFGKGLVTDPFGTGAAVKRELEVNPGGLIGEVAGSAAGAKVLHSLITKVGGAAVREVAKSNKNYVAPEKSGLEYVESTTVKTSKSELLNLEGKKTGTAHVTTSDLFKKGWFGKSKSILLEERPGGAKGFRQQNKLLHFYSSIKNRAYLGYAGISEFAESAGSKIKLAIKKPTVRAYVEDVLVSPSKKSGSLQDINIWQSKQSGKVMIPSENIKGLSVEGQTITPAKIKGLPGEGSILEKVGKSKFTYYKQTGSTFKNPALEFLFGKDRWNKIEIQQVRRKPVSGVNVLADIKPGVRSLDVTSYSKRVSSSAGSKVVTPSDILSSLSPYGSLGSKRVSKNNVSSSNVSSRGMPEIISGSSQRVRSSASSQVSVSRYNPFSIPKISKSFKSQSRGSSDTQVSKLISGSPSKPSKPSSPINSLTTSSGVSRPSYSRIDYSGDPYYSLISPYKVPPPAQPKKLGFVDFGFANTRKKGKQKIPKTRYQPTLGSKVFGITSKKIPGTYKIGGGGVYNRPLIGKKGNYFGMYQKGNVKVKKFMSVL